MAPNKNYIYPEQLIGLLQKEFARGRKIRLPARHLHTLLNTMYHASLRFEESRPVRLGVAYLPLDADEREMSLETLTGAPYFVPFQHRVPFDDRQLMRLAPAFDWRHSLICVSPSPNRGGGLEIEGILNLGSAWWDYVQSEELIGNALHSLLTITTTRPGQLTVSSGGWNPIQLENGRILHPQGEVFWHGPVGRRMERPAHELRSSMIAALGMDGDKAMTHPDWTREHYHSFFRRILFRVRDLGHGGTFLIMPRSGNEAAPQFSSLRLKYPCHSSRAWNLLLALLTNDELQGIREYSIPPEAKQIALSSHEEQVRLFLEGQSLQGQLRDYIDYISTLSGIDGAVVLTYGLELLGFGAEIVVPELEGVRLFEAQDKHARKREPQMLNAFGTRHRSAARFCFANPDALAFVISQDGDVRVFVHHQGSVVMWSHVDLNLVEGH